MAGSMLAIVSVAFDELQLVLTNIISCRSSQGRVGRQGKDDAHGEQCLGGVIDDGRAVAQSFDRRINWIAHARHACQQCMLSIEQARPLRAASKCAISPDSSSFVISIPTPMSNMAHLDMLFTPHAESKPNICYRDE